VHEIQDLQLNHVIEEKAEYLLSRIRHVTQCEFCKGFLETQDPKILSEKIRNIASFTKAKKESISKYYKDIALASQKCLSFAELDTLQNNRLVTIKAQHVVGKAWHIFECDSCQKLLRAAGLL